MKIRQGFISNSSSSCFIIALPKEPKDNMELFHMLFGDAEPNTFIDHKYFPAVKYIDVVDRIFKDIYNVQYTIVERNDDVLWTLSCQYYFDKHNISCNSRIGRYCGSDPKLYQTLKEKYFELNEIISAHYNLLINDVAIIKEKDRQAKCDKLWKITDKLKYQMAEIDLTRFLEDNPKSFNIMLVYHDNNGDDLEAFIESSGVFYNLPNITINRH